MTIDEIALDVLYDASGAHMALTAAERGYGGPLRFPETTLPYVVVNFVSTVDGVVSLGISDGTDASTISGHSAADRYVMAMLRAAADVIVIGARTLIDAPGHQFTAAASAPASAGELRDYRRALGYDSDTAPLVIVSARGVLPAHVALERPATPTTVLTSNAAAPVEREFPRVKRLVVEGGSRIDGVTLVETLAREFGARVVLCEGGPTLLGSLVAEDQVTELFLTVAPRVAGRDAEHPRRGLVEGYAAAPSLHEYALLSVRRGDSTLLLRYRRR